MLTSKSVTDENYAEKAILSATLAGNDGLTYDSKNNLILSGVKIKLMIAGVPDKKIPYWIAETYFEELLMAGVEIYRYKAGFIHCKNIVVDGRVSTMGTCNFDMRSFEINYEINSVFYNEEISRNIRNQFYEDLKKCEQIKEKNLKKTVFWRKIRNSLFKVISPIM